MLDAQLILADCLSQLQQVDRVSEEDVKKVLPQKVISDKYISCWKVEPVITIKDNAKRITLFMCFYPSFPYSWPEVYLLDKQFDYIAHIGYDDRKLCLFTDDEFTTPQDPFGMIRTALSRACKLIELSTSHAIDGDFAQEILHYWIFQYNKESDIRNGYLLSNIDRSNESLLLKASYIQHNVFIYDESDSDANRILKETDAQYSSTAYDVLYLRDIHIPNKPPYCITPESFQECCIPSSLGILKKFMKRHKHDTILIIFPIGDTVALGAISIPCTPEIVRGFRKGIISPTRYWLEKYKNFYWQRYVVYPYNISRIAERTYGQHFEKHNYWIGGLGSIGSNLIYFLNSEQNVSFTLADKEILTIDNIGRHLLGFSSIGKGKVTELKRYICSNRPEREVTIFSSTIEHVLFSEMAPNNTPDALFLCTGNTNAERYVLDNMKENAPNYPIFLLWLEPYAIAGHMVYINPQQGISSKFLNDYPYNLIARSEYAAKGHTFTKQESGCANTYTFYGGSDVTLFLSAMYPLIQKLIQTPANSTYFRWIGNVEIAKANGITLSAEHGKKGQIQAFPM